jgi:hypothetical protein
LFPRDGDIHLLSSGAFKVPETTPSRTDNRCEGSYETMKGKEFGEFLSDLSDVLRDANATEAAAALRDFVVVFRSAPNSDVSLICSVLSGIRPPEHTEGLRVRECRRRGNAFPKATTNRDRQKAGTPRRWQTKVDLCSVWLC